MNTRTFNIPNEMLIDTSHMCHEMFLRDVITKQELQALLGKLLYVSRCVHGARLNLLRDNHQLTSIHLPQEFYLDLWWFLKFLRELLASDIVPFLKSSLLMQLS